jgi:hypothetical protein
MNIRQLAGILANLKQIPRDAYCLSGVLPNESYCIGMNQDGKWCTYYSERGLRTGLKVFDSEDAACRHLLFDLQSLFK